jgi:hypothetical protein
MSEDFIPEARSMTPLLVLTGAALALDAFGKRGSERRVDEYNARVFEDRLDAIARRVRKREEVCWPTVSVQGLR